jgi:hypothetical protein
MALSLRLAQGITLIGDEDFPPFLVFQFLRLQVDPVDQVKRLPQGRHGGPTCISMMTTRPSVSRARMSR